MNSYNKKNVTKMNDSSFSHDHRVNYILSTTISMFSSFPDQVQDGNNRETTTKKILRSFTSREAIYRFVQQQEKEVVGDGGNDILIAYNDCSKEEDTLCFAITTAANNKKIIDHTNLLKTIQNKQNQGSSRVLLFLKKSNSFNYDKDNVDDFETFISKITILSFPNMPSAAAATLMSSNINLLANDDCTDLMMLNDPQKLIKKQLQETTFITHTTPIQEIQFWERISNHTSSLPEHSTISSINIKKVHDCLIQLKPIFENEGESSSQSLQSQLVDTERYFTEGEILDRTLEQLKTFTTKQDEQGAIIYNQQRLDHFLSTISLHIYNILLSSQQQRILTNPHDLFSQSIPTEQNLDDIKLSIEILLTSIINLLETVIDTLNKYSSQTQQYQILSKLRSQLNLILEIRSTQNEIKKVLRFTANSARSTEITHSWNDIFLSIPHDDFFPRYDNSNFPISGNKGKSITPHLLEDAFIQYEQKIMKSQVDPLIRHLFIENVIKPFLSFGEQLTQDDSGSCFVSDSDSIQQRQRHHILHNPLLFLTDKIQPYMPMFRVRPILVQFIFNNGEETEDSMEENSSTTNVINAWKEKLENEMEDYFHEMIMDMKQGEGGVNEDDESISVNSDSDDTIDEHAHDSSSQQQQQYQILYSTNLISKIQKCLEYSQKAREILDLFCFLLETVQDLDFGIHDLCHNLMSECKRDEILCFQEWVAYMQQWVKKREDRKEIMLRHHHSSPLIQLKYSTTQKQLPSSSEQQHQLPLIMINYNQENTLNMFRDLRKLESLGYDLKENLMSFHFYPFIQKEQNFFKYVLCLKEIASSYNNFFVRERRQKEKNRSSSSNENNMKLLQEAEYEMLVDSMQSFQAMINNVINGNKNQRKRSNKRVVDKVRHQSSPTTYTSSFSSIYTTTNHNDDIDWSNTKDYNSMIQHLSKAAENIQQKFVCVRKLNRKLKHLITSSFSCGGYWEYVLHFIQQQQRQKGTFDENEMDLETRIKSIFQSAMLSNTNNDSSTTAKKRRHSSSTTSLILFNPKSMTNWIRYWNQYLYQSLEKFYLDGLTADILSNIINIAAENASSSHKNQTNYILRRKRTKSRTSRLESQSCCVCELVGVMYNPQKEHSNTTQVQIHPSIPKLRKMWYTYLEPFIEFPFHFCGVADMITTTCTSMSSSHGDVVVVEEKEEPLVALRFSNIVTSNITTISKIYHNIEQILQTLENHVSKYNADWLILQQMDMKTILSTSCDGDSNSAVVDSPPHPTKNHYTSLLELLKAKQDEIEELPDYKDISVTTMENNKENEKISACTVANERTPPPATTKPIHISLSLIKLKSGLIKMIETHRNVVLFELLHQDILTRYQSIHEYLGRFGSATNSKVAACACDTGDNNDTTSTSVVGKELTMNNKVLVSSYINNLSIWNDKKKIYHMQKMTQDCNEMLSLLETELCTSRTLDSGSVSRPYNNNKSMSKRRRKASSTSALRTNHHSHQVGMMDTLRNLQKDIEETHWPNFQKELLNYDSLFLNNNNKNKKEDVGGGGAVITKDVLWKALAEGYVCTAFKLNAFSNGLLKQQLFFSLCEKNNSQECQVDVEHSRFPKNIASIDGDYSSLNMLESLLARFVEDGDNNGQHEVLKGKEEDDDNTHSNSNIENMSDFFPMPSIITKKSDIVQINKHFQTLETEYEALQENTKSLHDLLFSSGSNTFSETSSSLNEQIQSIITTQHTHHIVTRHQGVQQKENFIKVDDDENTSTAMRKSKESGRLLEDPSFVPIISATTTSEEIKSLFLKTKKDLYLFTKGWNYILDFCQDLMNVFGSMSWIQFRKNNSPTNNANATRCFSELENFCDKWNDEQQQQQKQPHEISSLSFTEKKEHEQNHYVVVKDMLIKIQKAIPSLKYCLGEAFREHHWTELLQNTLQMANSIRLENLHCFHFLIGSKKNNEERATANSYYSDNRDMMSVLNILGHSKTLVFVKELHIRATTELNIRETLQEFLLWCQTVEFDLFYYSDTKESHEEEKSFTATNLKISLIKNWTNLFVELGDRNCTLSTLMSATSTNTTTSTNSSSSYSVSEKIRTLEEDMTTLQNCLELLCEVQKKWIYLEPIFCLQQHLLSSSSSSSSNTNASLLEKPKQWFSLVNHVFGKIMKQIEYDPKLFHFISLAGNDYEDEKGQASSFIKESLSTLSSVKTLGIDNNTDTPAMKPKKKKVKVTTSSSLSHSELLPSLLRNMIEILERCHHALFQYLEGKRSYMPRFYFLGDDDLIEFIGGSGSRSSREKSSSSLCSTYNKHIHKLFQGIHTVTIKNERTPKKSLLLEGEDSPSYYIQSIHSSDGDTVTLLKPTPINSQQAEVWVSELVNEQQHTLQQLLSSYLNKSKNTMQNPEELFIPRNDSKSNKYGHPSQIIDLIENVFFAQQVESIIKHHHPSKLMEYYETLSKRLNGLTSLFNCSSTTLTKSSANDDSLIHRKVNHLILDIIHNRDIVGDLIKIGSVNVDDWAWQKILRYYHSSSNLDVTVKMSTVSLNYTFEYQGNASKLVLTPLSEKCFLCLTQCLKHGFGGSLYGPAGTGKTETVKALGGLLGRQVLVFNCDDSMDYSSMRRIFCGLLGAGAFGCFDEFNRLKQSQLSVISQDIQQIQDALKNKRNTITMQVNGNNPGILQKKEISINPSCGIFVTLNPANKSYGGRSILPENLKALFRPFAMDVPDNVVISQIFLYAQGFQKSPTIGKQVVSLFQNSEILLSKQRHYDWGLRALKTILRSAGDILSRHKNKSNQRDKDLEKVETSIVIEAIRINILSKLTKHDTAIFNDLLFATFPFHSKTSISDDPSKYHEKGPGNNFTLSMIEDVIQNKLSLEIDSCQIEKVFQLKAAIDQRMGCMIVGRSGTGKSTLLQILKEVLSDVDIHYINPKSLTRRQLLGFLDTDTQEWRDGVMTNIARKASSSRSSIIPLDNKRNEGAPLTNNNMTSQSLSKRSTWIILDGNVDPEWIEALNSVLDDNKLLTLPNGERICFDDTVKFIFETDDLQFASPATISRVGIVYIGKPSLSDSSNNLMSKIISSWWKKYSKNSSNDEEMKQKMKLWVDSYFSKAIEYSIDPQSYSSYQAHQSVSTTLNISVTSAVVNVLEHIKNAQNEIEFLLGIIYGLLPIVSNERRYEFTHAILSLSKDIQVHKDTDPLDYYYDGILRVTSLEQVSYNKESSKTYRKMEELIFTKSVQRAIRTLKPFFSYDGKLGECPFIILFGPNGCAKSHILLHLVKSSMKKESGSSNTKKNTMGNLMIREIYCNSETDPESIISYLKQDCSVLLSSQEKKIIRPSNNKLVYVFKNLDLLSCDTYGSSRLISFLTQILTHGGFYDCTTEEGNTLDGGKENSSKSTDNINSSSSSSLEFLYLDQSRIQFMGTMNTSSLERRKSKIQFDRFLSKVKYGVVDHPDYQDMVYLCSLLLAQKFSSQEREITIPNEISNDSLRHNLSRMMVETYETVRKVFLSTSRENHEYYQLLFSPKSLIGWCEGLTRYDYHESGDIDEHRFWICFVHEGLRHFSDCALSLEDKKECLEIFHSVFKKSLLGCASLFSNNIYFTPLSKIIKDNDFEDFRSDDSSTELSMTEILLSKTDANALTTILQYITSNLDFGVQDSAMFIPEFLQNFTNLEHGLTRNKTRKLNTVLIVSIPGVGKQNLVKLVCAAHNIQVVTPPYVFNYSIQNFQSTLKEVIQKCTMEDSPVCFFIPGQFLFSRNSSSESKSSEFSLLNLLVASSSYREVLHILFTSDELVSLYEKNDDNDEILSSRLRRNLTICISLDSSFISKERQPLTESYVDIFEKIYAEHPWILRKFSLIKLDDWSMNTMKEYCYQQLSHLNLSEMDEKIIIKSMIQIHCDISSGETPLHLQKLVHVWETLHTIRSREIECEMSQLEKGVQKLEETKLAVLSLSSVALEQKAQLMKAQDETEKAMNNITEALMKSEYTKREISSVKTKLETETLKIAEEKKFKIQSKLDEIAPLLKEAKEAVNGIKRDNLNEIRSLKSPPQMIVHVLSGVLMLLGIEDLSWVSMKKFLGNREIKSQILNFNKFDSDDENNNSKSILKSVKKLLEKNPKSFEDACIKRVSVAAAPLAKWVKANTTYGEIVQNVKPLKNELSQIEELIKNETDRLNECELELQELENRVQSLKQEFTIKTKETDSLKTKFEETEIRCKNATSLMNNLGDEHDRWLSRIKELTEEKNSSLRINCLLCSAFIVYLAKLSDENIRKKYLSRWENLYVMSSESKSDKLSFSKYMGIKTHRLMEWKNMSLPEDSLCIENAFAISSLLMSSTSQYKRRNVLLIIDPEGVSYIWLQNYLSQPSQKIEYVSMNDSRLPHRIELCMRFGKTVIVKDLDSSNKSVFNFFFHPLINSFSERFDSNCDFQRKVWLNGKLVECHDNFNVIFYTTIPNLALSEYLYEINFAVTKAGMQQKLLERTFMVYEPTLEQEKKELRTQEHASRMELQGLEEDLTNHLSEDSDVDLLQNVTLIKSLTKTKEKAKNVSDILEQLQEKNLYIIQKEQFYEDNIVKFASHLYFVVIEFYQINPMYRFGNLHIFLQLFERTLVSQRSSCINSTFDDMGNDDRKDDNKRSKTSVKFLRKVLMIELISYFGTSLLKRDRLMFVFFLIIKCYDALSWNEVSLDIFFSTTDERTFSFSDEEDDGQLSTQKQIKLPTWLTQQSYDEILAYNYMKLSDLSPSLRKVLSSDLSNWIQCETCEEHPLISNLSPMEKLMMIKSFRPDRLLFSIQRYCCEVLEVDSIHQLLSKATTGITSKQPKQVVKKSQGKFSHLMSLKHRYFMLVTTKGSDPSKELEEFATQQIGEKRYRTVSLGGDPSTYQNILSLCQTCASNGDWLCLKNLHIVLDWLPSLESYLSSLESSSETIIHEDFKLWFLTESSDKIPKSLLERSLKITFESPPGIKQNMVQTLNSWGATSEISKRYFILAWFHALVVERNDIMGYSTKYDFGMGELRAGKLILSENTEWDCVHGLFMSFVYGGRITNTHDELIVRNYVKRYLSQDIYLGKKLLNPSHSLRIPTTNKSTMNYVSCVNEISKLPDHDKPSMFGLSNGIQHSLQKCQSTRFLSETQKLSMKISSLVRENCPEEEEEDCPKLKGDMKTVIKFWSKLKNNYPIVKQICSSSETKTVQTSQNIDPENKIMSSFLNREEEFGFNLIRNVDKSLLEVDQSALETKESLATGIVPEIWLDSFWCDGPKQNIYKWLECVVKSYFFLTQLKSLGFQQKKTILLNTSYYSLYDFDAFLCTFKQSVAIQLKCSMNELRLTCSWESQSSLQESQLLSHDESEPLSIILKGLCIQGATYDGSYVTFPSERDQGNRTRLDNDAEFHDIPFSLILRYTQYNDEFSQSIDSYLYSVPVYNNIGREKQLFRGEKIYLSCRDESDVNKCILANVSLFLCKE